MKLFLKWLCIFLLAFSPILSSVPEASAANKAVLVKGSIQPLTGTLNTGTIQFIKHDKKATTFSTTVKNNQFQLQLQDGMYSAFQYYDPSKSQYTQMSYSFKVSKGKTSPTYLKIPIKPFNIKGSVRIGARNTITGTMKVVCQSCKLPTTYTASVKKGSYQLYLPNGSYKVTSIYNASDKKSTNFSYSFEVKSGRATAPVVITINEDNLMGTAQKGGKSIQKGWFEAKTTNSNKFVNVENGQFSANLPDGTYTVHSVHDDVAWIDYYFEPITFTIINSKPTSKIMIDIPEDNVTGTFTTSTGALKSGSFYVYNLNDMKAPHYKFPIENGKFSAYIPDGYYAVRNIFEDGRNGYKMVDFTFNVKNGKSVSGPLTIHIPDDNIQGSVTIGDKPAGQGSITIVSNQGGIHTASVLYGQFSLSLPDGSYSVRHYKDSFFNRTLDIPFTVHQGKPSVEKLQIKLQADNFFGKAVKKGNTLKSAIMIISGEKGNRYMVDINDYRFSTSLPEGNYQVLLVDDKSNDALYEGGISFSISNSGPATPVTLLLKDDNVKLTVTSKKTDIVTGRIHINSKNNLSYTIPIKKGSISTYLRDGEYKIETYYPDNGEKPVPLNFSFTVTNGVASQANISVIIPEVNLNVTVLKSGKLIENGVLYIRNSQDMVHTFEIFNGKVNIILADGDYQFIRVYDRLAQKSQELDIALTVKNSIAIINPLTIVLKDDNVTGTIKMGNIPAPNGTLMIKTKDNMNSYSMPIKDGVFSNYLPNGEYIITHYFPTGGKTRTLDIEFQVIYGKQSIPISITLPSNNFKGNVKKGGLVINSGNMNVVNKSGTDYYFINITNGEYSEYLPDGDYAITGVYINEISEPHTERIEFEVRAGIVSIPSTIQFSMNNFKGSINKDGVGLSGTLEIWSETDRKTKYVPVKNGLYSTFLPDGIYIFKNFMDLTFKNYDSFEGTSVTIKDGKANQTINIEIPKDNFLGKVMKSGKVIKSGYLLVRNKDTGMQKYVDIKNEAYSSYLRDGEYEITNVYNENDENGFHPEMIPFQVKYGQVSLSATIVLKDNNLIGTVMKGSTGINGTVYVKTEDGKTTYLVKAVNGAFSVYLPIGEYSVVRVWTGNNEEDFEPVSFKIVDGKATSSLKIVVK